MNRCSICDVTDEDNPKAGIRIYDVPHDPGLMCRITEFRCLTCQSDIESNIEDLSIGDEDFEFQNK
jgi:hypothetical protein